MMDERGTEFIVVVNEEGQYSLWPGEKPIPPGWHDAQCRGTKDFCLAFIERVWLDIRPLGLRRSLGR